MNETLPAVPAPLTKPNWDEFNAELDALCQKHGVTLAPDLHPQFVSLVHLLLDGVKQYPPILRASQKGG